MEGGSGVVYRVVGRTRSKADCGQQTERQPGPRQDTTWKKYTDSPGVGTPPSVSLISSTLRSKLYTVDINYTALARRLVFKCHIICRKMYTDKEMKIRFSQTLFIEVIKYFALIINHVVKYLMHKTL